MIDYKDTVFARLFDENASFRPFMVNAETAIFIEAGSSQVYIFTWEALAVSVAYDCGFLVSVANYKTIYDAFHANKIVPSDLWLYENVTVINR